MASPFAIAGEREPRFAPIVLCMKRILSTSEIIGIFSRGAKELEVCASAEAEYDESCGQAVIELDSFIRPVEMEGKEQHLSEVWLPPRQCVKESVSRREASEAAKEIFHRWVGKVRQSIPTTVHNQ